MNSVIPFLPLMIGAFAAILLRGWLRNTVMLIAPIVGAINLMGLEQGVFWSLEFMGYALEPVRVDKLSMMFGYLFHLASFIAIVYALHVKDTVQHVAGLAYAASAVGAVFAGDLLTLFIFWELLALTSVFLVWARRTDRAYSSGFRYLIFQVLSGVLLLAGLLILAQVNDSLLFNQISLQHEGIAQIGAWLIFFALALNARSHSCIHG